MTARAGYVAALEAQIAGAGLTDDVAAVLDRPVSPIPGTPAVLVTPGNPYIESAGPRQYLVRLDVVLFAGRLDTQTAMETLDLFLPLIRYAAPEAEMRWLRCTVGVQTVAGVEYVTARSQIEGDTSAL